MGGCNSAREEGSFTRDPRFAGKFQLEYFGIFAKGVAPACALEIGGFDWEMGATPGDKGTSDFWAEWLEMKPNTKWGFLPNLVAGDDRIGSEIAILQFLEAENPQVLSGQNRKERMISQELLFQSEELYQKFLVFVPTIMAKDKSPDAYKKFVEGADRSVAVPQMGLQVYLAQFEEYYKECGRSDAQFTTTGTTVGELKLFAVLMMLFRFKVDALESYPNLEAFVGKLNAKKEIKAVIEGTAKNMKGPWSVAYFIAPGA